MITTLLSIINQLIKTVYLSSDDDTLNKEIFVKFLLLASLFIGSSGVYACSDVDADQLVLDRTKMMAKRYNAKKIGVGVTMLWGDTRITSISIMDGDGANDGKRIDRMGTIFINMNTCVVKAKLIGVFDTIELN